MGLESSLSATLHPPPASSLGLPSSFRRPIHYRLPLSYYVEIDRRHQRPLIFDVDGSTVLPFALFYASFAPAVKAQILCSGDGSGRVFLGSLWISFKCSRFMRASDFSNYLPLIRSA